MSKVYESLRDVVHETLQRSKNNPIPFARVKHNDASSLNDEIADLEKIIVQKMSGLKTAVKHGEEVVEKETQHAEQVIQTLTENITMLETKLKQTEDTFRRKESASQKMEKSLSAKIHDLQDELKKKNEILNSRDNEINTLKPNVDALVKQVAELELTLNKAKVNAETEAKRTEELTERSNAKIAALELQIRDINELIHAKESTIKAVEQNLIAKSQEFENHLRNKETLLAAREAEINDLKSQLQLLTRGVKEMSSFFKQAESLATVEGRNGSKAAVSQRIAGVEEKPAGTELKNPSATPNKTETAQQAVRANFFDRVTHELTQIMGPLAPMIVRDHVAALGESMEKFPQSRVSELLEVLSKEILNENLKTRFRVWSERIHTERVADR
jgi:chromosome segregation ATPase